MQLQHRTTTRRAAGQPRQLATPRRGGPGSRRAAHAPCAPAPLMSGQPGGSSAGAAAPVICRSVRLRATGCAAEDAACAACGGRHAALGDGPLRVVGGGTPAAVSPWRIVDAAAAGEAVAGGALPPLRACAAVAGAHAGALELEVRVSADEAELVRRARFSIYPPWPLGPGTRCSWRLELHMFCMLCASGSEFAEALGAPSVALLSRSVGPTRLGG